MRYPIGVCEYSEATYPSWLRDIKGMPQRFYYKGDLGSLSCKKRAAVIGSRKCDAELMLLAREAGRATAEEETILINGLAIGCDTEAIRGALEAGGKCVAVMPGGLDEIYPLQNSELAIRILETGGCLISEYEPGAKPQKYTFVQRDRLQSAFSKGIFVVGAETGGGTIQTVKSALKLGRRVACYAYALSHMDGNKVLVENNTATEIRNVDELRKYLQEIGNITTCRQMSFEDLC